MFLYFIFDKCFVLFVMEINEQVGYWYDVLYRDEKEKMCYIEIREIEILFSFNQCWMIINCVLEKEFCWYLIV